MKKIHCSVPILTLNRRMQLERMLPMVLEAFDDVFIIDGNSTDGTREYARSLGVRIENQFESNEPDLVITNFQKARVDSWAKCKYDWILYLDSDEVPTAEFIVLVRRLVDENDARIVHRMMKHLALPDGRIIRHSPFYATPTVRLFTRRSGVTLADRKVHERFMIPEGVSLQDHDEAIICPELKPVDMRKRNLRYLEMETQSLQNTSWKFFWKWIVWYNLKSFAGQLVRIFQERIENFFRRKPSLPWAYNVVFLRYRIDSMIVNTRAWMKKRKSSEKENVA